MFRSGCENSHSVYCRGSRRLQLDCESERRAQDRGFGKPLLSRLRLRDVPVFRACPIDTCLHHGPEPRLFPSRVSAIVNPSNPCRSIFLQGRWFWWNLKELILYKFIGILCYRSKHRTLQYHKQPLRCSCVRTNTSDIPTKVRNDAPVCRSFAGYLPVPVISGH